MIAVLDEQRACPGDAEGVFWGRQALSVGVGLPLSEGLEGKRFKSLFRTLFMAYGDWLKIGIILLIIAVILLVVYLGKPSAKGAWILEAAGIFLGVCGVLSLLAGLLGGSRNS